MKITFSIIITILNRKKELFELLNSLILQSYKEFEVLIIDDGSSDNLFPIINRFNLNLNIYYYKKHNSGPGLSRNFGSKLAKNNYLIFFDSDCLIPKDYLNNVVYELKKKYVYIFGGPDYSHNNFNIIQKAISYSMTSILSSGGIRGSKNSLIQFQPRSFNMGIDKKIFLLIGGFSNLKIGEDIDLILRCWKKGFITKFFYRAYVYHKRRNTILQFAKQMYKFGISRKILNNKHKNYNKIIFYIPTLLVIIFIINVCLIYFLYLNNNYINFLTTIISIFYFLYIFMIFIHSTYINKSINVGFFSVITTIIQINSYGLGFLHAYIKINILKKTEEKAFPSHFYIKKNICKSNNIL